MSAAPVAIGPAARIECSPQVIEELRRTSPAPFTGLLWGRLPGSRLSIEVWTPCGEPSQPLTTSFQRELRKGPPVPGLQCLGWVCSRQQREARLTEEDHALFDACFPEPWQTALIIRPGFQRPTHAAFYYRNSPSLRPTQEFFLQPPGPTPVLLPPPSARRFRYSPWAAAALVLTGLLVGSALPSSGENKPDQAREPLRITARGSDWELRWDRRGLELAREHRLEMSLGKSTQSRPLSETEIRSGLVRVPVAPGDLRVALIFERQGSPKLEERVLVLGKSAGRKR